MMAGLPSKMKSRGDYLGLVVPVCGDFTGIITTPWRLARDTKTHQQASVRLHYELESFIRYISPSPAEEAARKDVFARLSSTLSRIKPSAVLDLSGSSCYSLCFPTSDIDVVCTERGGYNYNDANAEVQRRALISIDFQLKQNFSYNTTPVFQASVPLLTIRDLRTGLDLDLTYRNRRPASTDDPVKVAITWQRRLDALEGNAQMLSKIVLVLKHILAMRRLNKTFTGGINSYVLFWMVVAWLELEYPRVRQTKAHLVLFCDSNSHPSTVKRPNFGVLLIEILAFYGERFQYTLKSIKLTPTPHYAPKMTNFGAQSYLLSIEDPASRTDPGAKAYGIKHVAATFAECARLLQRSIDNPGNVYGNESLLKGVLGGNYSVLEQRRRSIVRPNGFFDI